jgi:hypothetical protein
VSENCFSVCHYTPQAIFGLPTFQCLFPDHQQPQFISCLYQIHDTFIQTGKSAEPKASTVSIIDPDGNLTPFCCATHFIGGEHNLFICEFEPLKAPTDEDEALPPMQLNTLGNKPPTIFASQNVQLTGDNNEIAQTTMESQALAEDSYLEAVAIVSQIHLRFAAAFTVPALLQAVVEIIQELSKFHRVMVYQFDLMYNGSVVAELLDTRASVDSYKGLHFPASDIPKQARDLVGI